MAWLTYLISGMKLSVVWSFQVAFPVYTAYGRSLPRAFPVAALIHQPYLPTMDC